MRPGTRDKKYQILITGKELQELQRYAYTMAESFGLDRRVMAYQPMVLVDSAVGWPCEKENRPLGCGLHTTHQRRTVCRRTRSSSACFAW
jgi:hypothetical protein